MSGQGDGDGAWVAPGSTPGETEVPAPAAAGDVGLGAGDGGAGGASRRARVLTLVGAAVVIVALVGVGVAVTGSDDEDAPGEAATAAEDDAEDDDRDETDDGDDSEATGPAPTEPPTTTTTTAPGPTTQVVDGVAGEFRLELPADWVAAPLDDDAGGAGARLFPDDPGDAAFADGVAELVASTGPRLLAADAELPARLSSAPPPILALERQPFDRGLEPTVQAFLDAYAGVGVTDTQRRDLTGAFGPIVAIENHDVDRVDYFFVGGGQTWKLAYVSATGGFVAELPGIDQVAQSFTAAPVAAA